MLLIDPADGRIVDANLAAVRFYGYPRAVLLKMNISEINRLPPHQTRQEWQKALQQRQNEFIFSHRLAGGGVRTVAVHSSPIDVDHKPILFSIIHDVTEQMEAQQSLEESERRIRHLFESMSEGFATAEMVYDGEGKPIDYRYLMVNQPYADALGFPVERIVGRPMKEINPEIEPEWIEAFNRVVSTGVSERIYSRVAHLKRHVEVSAWRFAPGQFGIVVNDITELMLLQEKIARLYQKEKAHRQKLEADTKVKGLFNDIVAHELKNPLTAVLSSSGMLKDLSAGENDLHARLAANIYDGVVALAKRLDDLLDIGRFARGTFQLRKEPFDASRFIRDLAARYEPAIVREGKKLSVSIEGEPGVLVADPSRLEQAIVNLLSNANKYSPAKSTIYLSARIRYKRLVIEVKDEGCGIAQENLGRLFDAYYRVDQTASAPGIGLGLYISKLIVEAHRGEIRVASQVGRGSAFSVLIPTNLKPD